MPTSPTPFPFRSEPTFHDALESRRAHLAALDPKKLPSVRLNAAVLFQSAIGAAHRLEAFRQELVAQFGDEATELLDSLVPAAQAARLADAMLKGQPKRPSVAPIHAELVSKHALLLADARALVARGLLPAEVLRKTRDARGYGSAVRSVLVLVSVFERHWAQISELTPTTRADLRAANRLAAELVDAAAVDTTSEHAATAELRRRAIGDAVRIYEELRRQMSYLRWHRGDVDTIVPSLFAGRGGRKKRRKSDGSEPVAPSA